MPRKPEPIYTPTAERIAQKREWFGGEDYVSTLDKPNLGDPTWVEGQVKAIAAEMIAVRIAYNKDELASEDVPARLEAIVDKYSAEFKGAIQTLSPEGFAIWLTNHGYENVEAVVANVLSAVTDATVEHEQGNLSLEGAGFRCQVAIEEAIGLLMGLEPGIVDESPTE